MQKLLALSEKTSVLFARIGGLLLLSCAFLIVAEVLLRKFFNYSFQGTDEFSGYALSISLALALPYTLVKRGHIRVDAVYNICSTTVAAILNWISILAMSIFSIFLLYSSYDVLHSSIRFDATSNTPLSTPLWIPQSTWIIGFLVFFLVCSLIFIASTIFLFKGEFTKIKLLIGRKSIQEELAE